MEESMATNSLGVPRPKCCKKDAVGLREKKVRSGIEHVCIERQEKLTIG
jgi:hypothetical protein